MVLNTFVINENNYEEELSRAFSTIDADFNGDNGPEFLCAKSKENGFESNLEYSLDKNQKQYKNVIDIIENVIKDCTTTWGSCYKDWNYEVIKEDNKIIIALATY